MSKIGFYFGGNLHNNYCGVHGLINILLPMIKKLHENGHTILWLGNVIENKKKNVFADILTTADDYHRNFLDARNICNKYNNEKLDAVILEMRPSFNKEEFDKVKNIIDSHENAFIYDGDLWANDLPQELKNKVTLLRPYLKENESFEKQVEFHYYYRKELRNFYEMRLKKCIDLLYVGNEYGRKDKFNSIVGELSKFSNHNIVVGGNWLKESKRENALQFENILYVREVPHWQTVPLLNHAYYTLQIVRPEYCEVGLMSHRIYEAVNANTLCLADKNIFGIEKFIPKELLFDTAKDIDEIISSIDDMSKYVKLLYRSKKSIEKHHLENRIKELETLIKYG